MHREMKILARSVLLLLVGFALLQAQDLRSATEKLDVGIRAYQSDKMDSAKVAFAEAASSFQELLQGVQSSEDAAYTRYYRATALYYIARIGNSSDGFTEASDEFKNAIGSFKDIETLGEEYVRSNYYRGLCSFRKFQLASTERGKARFLEDAIGDFQAFLSDEVVVNDAEDYKELIDNANFYAGWSMYFLAEIKGYKKSTLSEAKSRLPEAENYFKEGEKADDERLALVAKFMQAECHYLLARIYMRVDEKNWSKYKLSKLDRSTAITDELNNANTLVEKAISSAGAQKDLQMYAKMSNHINDIALGSVGDQKKLTEVLTTLTDLLGNSKWGSEAQLRIADGVLLQYLIFSGNPKTVINSLGKIASSVPEAAYWRGWISFIQGDYEKARGSFSSFMASNAGNRTIRGYTLQADAKFRFAECQFWQGVKTNNVALLNDAASSFKALADPSGQYSQYLSSETQRKVQTRLFLIKVESTLQGESDVSVFQAAMEFAGLKLPADADEYLNVGRYFLEKGIQTAEAQRKNALAFAQKAFDLVLNNSGVDGGIKNKAKFMKGVGLIKLATIQEGGEQKATLQKADALLTQCTSPYNNEAKYVQGIGYFMVNDYTNAKAIFGSLKSKGHIRATYYYALSASSCPDKGKALAQVMATVKDRADYWYQSASMEFDKLSCKGSVGSQPPLSSTLKIPPMTYENLVDKNADIARKKAIARYMWQCTAREKKLPDVDDLITDKPPETNVTVQFAIEPSGGEESVIIDGDPAIAEAVGQSKYKATLTRGTHTIEIKKKGFYVLSRSQKISKTETITITLDKAVRYTPAGALGGADEPMAVTTSGDDIFVANNLKSNIIHIGADGSVIGEIPYDSLAVTAVTALAVDGDVLLVGDSRRNKVVMTSFDGSDVNVVVYGNEEYGDKKLLRPSGITAHEGTYYIVDSGNRRVLVFEGASFRRTFGGDVLKKPIGIAFQADGEHILVADIIKGALMVFNNAGDLDTSIVLSEQKTPSAVFIDKDGYIYVADFLANNVAKYTPGLKLLSVAGSNLESPRGIALIGQGPDATMYVATDDKVSVLKASWDNAYMPK